MDKDLIQKGVAAAQQEAEQEKIGQIKELVRLNLTEKERWSKIKKEAAEKEKFYERELDDLKAGRLDKIKERQEVDETARRLSLMAIDTGTTWFPTNPWQSSWFITYTDSNKSGGTIRLTGKDFCNFVQGTFNINGKIINF